MTQHCPLCGSRVQSLANLRWSQTLASMPGPMKLDAMRRMTGQSKPSPDGRWLYATKEGAAFVCSPSQMQQIIGQSEAEMQTDFEETTFGEDHED